MSKNSIKLFHTSDIHGHFLSVDYAQKKVTDGGVSRLATFLHEARTPDDIHIDTGDILQGSALAYYLAKHPQDTHPFADVFNHLQVDYATLGNHDFNYGRTLLDSFTQGFKGRLLNANITEKNAPFCGVASHIRTLPGGLKMGIMGVTTHYIPNWERPEHIQGLTFKDAFSTVKDHVTLMRPYVDILVVNYHGGFEGDFKTGTVHSTTGENQGYHMVQDIPGIDLLLTGHQHQTVLQKVNDTWVSQPGMNALGVNVITLPLSAPFDANEVSVERIRVQDMKEDPHIQAMLSPYETATQAYLDQPMGSFDQAYRIHNGFNARRYKHPLVTWINEVQLAATGADIALCGLGNDVTGFNQDVTLRDILATYVYPNLLVVKQVSGKALKEALEKTAGFFALKDGEITVSDDFEIPKKEYYNYDMYDPIRYTIDVSKPVGNRIQNLSIDGTPIQPEDRFKVAMNNYRAAGGGDYFMYQDAPLILDTQTEIVDYLIQALSGQKHITLTDPKNITVIGD